MGKFFHVLSLFKISIISDTTLITTTTNVAIDTIDNFNLVICLTENNINFENRILIDYYSHIVTPIHKLIDKTTERASNNKIGTTCKGIGPTYQDKYQRVGIRAIDLFNIESLKLKISERLQTAIDKKEIIQEDINSLDFRDFYESCIKITPLSLINLSELFISLMVCS